MAMDNFQVNLPKTFLPFINQAEGKNLDAKVKLTLAIGMYVEKQVTLARAAELAETNLADFIDILKSKKIPWLEYSEESFHDDLHAISELLSLEEESHE